MVEPQIKSRLESNHFVTLDPKVKARLDQCLAVDFMHFTPGKRDMNTVDGKAVHALQEALTKIKQNILLSLPAITDSPGDYSSTTKGGCTEL